MADRLRGDWASWALDPVRFDPTLWFLAVHRSDAVGVTVCEGARAGRPDTDWVGVGKSLLLRVFRAPSRTRPDLRRTDRRCDQPDRDGAPLRILGDASGEPVTHMREGTLVREAEV
jgi:hypothetical protein